MSSGIFTGLQKAAVLLITLGPERSSEIIKFLSEPEIEQLTLEMSNMRKVSEEQRDSVIDEFHKMCLASNYIAQGGIEYARDVLERALGQQRAFDIIGRLSSSLKMRPFDIVRRTDAKQLFSFIQGEHPQTISLIMTHLPSDKAATILGSLPQDLQAEVTKRIALMGRTSPEVLKEIEKVLENKISNLAPTDYTSSGGMQSVVDMLNRTDPGTLKTVMDVLEMDDPDLAEQIKRQMFVFDDVILLDDRSVQLVLREVEEAQQKIVKVIRKLEEAGAIVISRGGADEIIY